MDKGVNVQAYSMCDATGINRTAKTYQNKQTNPKLQQPPPHPPNFDYQCPGKSK